MKVKELVQTCKGIKKVVVHTRNGFEFLGEWEESQFKYFDLWEKSTWLVKSWQVERKVLYVIIY
jgi:hypothetical protein